MIKEITIPNIGENVKEGTVVDIKVAVGDMVEQDQTIIEFETDKALVEIPAPEAGKITEVKVNTGDTLKIGELVAKIDTEGEAATDKKTTPAKTEEDKTEEKAKQEPPQPAPEKKKEEPAPAKQAAKPAPAAPEPQEPRHDEPRAGELAPAAPSVRRLARELGANIDEVTGSGPGGRITFEDVKAHVKQIVTSGPAGGTPIAAGAKPLPDFSKWGEIETEKMSRVRSVIAAHVSNASNTVAQVTQFDNADITEVERFRQQFGKRVEKRDAKLTITAILLKVCAEALKQFPRFNASIDPANEQIIYKKYSHIGIATDTNRGLLVPVIRDADKKSIVELAVALKEIAEKTRAGKLEPDEMEGATFTISNQGSIGGANFTPIVSWPQVAILGVSRGSVQPVYIDGEFEPRTILPLSLSYDHRIVDGADAARFLKWIKDALEHPLLLSFE